ncbi:hypothetical protein ES708_29004 [subsurface metagenome]
MLLKSTIREVIQSQQEQLESRDTGIGRQLLDEIRLDTGFVLIITGIRRSGKSTLLRQLIRGKIQGACFLNFEDPMLTGFESKDFVKLDEIFPESNDDPFYVFDEIQNIKGWENYIRYKQDNGKKIILTGSNATLLSKELGTKLTGRHLDYELYPFSYSEYLKMTRSVSGINSFMNYMNTGGFPEYIKYGEKEILYRITDDILYRDITARHGIRHHTVLKELLIYLITNNGKLFSYNNLKKIFSLGSPNTVSDYISFFEDSYLLFTVPKFSYSVKKQMTNLRKTYTIDTGLAGINSLSMSKDMGRKLENLLFIHLRKKYKRIFYYAERGECDFLVQEKEKITKAIQVCYELNPDNLDRELDGLYEAMQAVNITEGLIITVNQEDHFAKDKMSVRVIPAWKWLAEG